MPSLPLTYRPRTWQPRRGSSQLILIMLLLLGLAGAVTAITSQQLGFRKENLQQQRQQSLQAMLAGAEDWLSARQSFDSPLPANASNEASEFALVLNSPDSKWRQQVVIKQTEDEKQAYQLTASINAGERTLQSLSRRFSISAQPSSE
ncbi:hypothetical protein FF011L_20100 [Roseimaritima multifibrata]|uniref:Uncharacterized protein n=2 Tax=Roseimaritima multifibrata TaxID=1930274 RepID=A0A517MED7_9BACT|nr:hypothetical protein FF011L_20100 [Roseimaritima multifibrata]